MEARTGGPDLLVPDDLSIVAAPATNDRSCRLQNCARFGHAKSRRHLAASDTAGAITVALLLEDFVERAKAWINLDA
jgi:hypothetical protein